MGPTWIAKHRRLDAWAMKCSWTNNKMIGYEIKISRSDFLQDKKWRDYLPVCTQFFFVCPHGLIRVDEVEDPAGLIYLSKTGRMLRTVKAAKLLEPKADALNLLLTYVLMSRCEITDRPRHGAHRAQTDFERAEREMMWLRRERRSKRVGHALSKLMASTK